MSRHAITAALHSARRGMIPNRAGGAVFPVDPWTHLDRVLILGTTDNTYYASGAELTLDAVSQLTPLIQAHGARVVQRIADISTAGRAPSNTPALMLLALALTVGDESTKRMAVDVVPRVARTGTHIQELASYLDALRGWGRAARRSVQRWFLDRDPRDLAYQAIKYQARGGWSLRRTVRVSHPRARDERQNAVLHWIACGWPGIGPEPHPEPALVQIWAFERIKRLPPTDVREAAQIVADYALPREAVPTHFLQHAEMWAALLERMPLTATLRNLATLTRLGVLAPLNDATQRVCARLTNPNALRAARIHPLHILVALRTYAAGRSARSGQTWTPIPAITSALDQAFDLAFQTIPPTGKRILFALDVSGSMSGPAFESLGGLTPREIGGVMLMTLARCEPHWHALWFHETCGVLPVTPQMSMREVIETILRMPSGGTDISAPLLYAIAHRSAADALVVFTDNETWRNREPVDVVLDRYRQVIGNDAALVIIAATATKYSVASPHDPHALNVAGFDLNVPALVRGFIAGFAADEPLAATEDDE